MVNHSACGKGELNSLFATIAGPFNSKAFQRYLEKKDGAA